MNTHHADVAVISVETDRVFVIDENIGGRSITNDAEWVWARVATQYPGRRLVYRDTMGRWDEIAITRDGDAVFLPYHGPVPIPQ
jgi:hypothetical protein